MPSPTLLLVGGGHASVHLLRRARRLTEAGARVVMLSDHPTMFYSGMVPEFTGGVYAPRHVQIDLVDWCRRTGSTWVRGTAARLDADARTVTTADGRSLDYDIAVFDIGARNPGRAAARGAVLTKPMHRIRAFERFLGELRPSRSEPPHVLIVGGGAAGVEVALNVSARFARPLGRGTVHLTVAEPGERLLAGFARSLSAHAEADLRQRGVHVLLNTRVTNVTEGCATTADGRTVPCSLALWATGSRGSTLFRRAGLPCDDRGFVRVSDTLQVRGHPDLFAAGDCAVVRSHPHLRRIGVHAVKQGPVLTHNVSARVRAYLGRHSRPMRTFTPYPVAPLILSTGTRDGILAAGPFWLRSPLALRLKHLVDLRWIRPYQRADRQAPYALWHGKAAGDGALEKRLA